MAPKRGRAARGSASLAEIRAVWTLLALDAAAVFATYWRLPPTELYHVHLHGFEAGASRLAVFLNFPTGLAAIAILGLTVERLRGRWVTPVAVAALVLCAAVAWPGVVDDGNLTVKWANAFALAGVAIVLVLSLLPRAPGPTARPTRDGDQARLVVGAIAALGALPYIAADLGLFLDRLPVLGSVFITGKPFENPDGTVTPAVHHGHHHGMDGFLLALTALLLSRQLGSVSGRRLRAALAAYLSLMLVYGLTNMVNDLWSEQIVKRGWTTWEVPDVLEPKASLAWLAMIAAAAVVYVLFFGPRRASGGRA